MIFQIVRYWCRLCFRKEYQEDLWQILNQLGQIIVVFRQICKYTSGPGAALKEHRSIADSMNIQATSLILCILIQCSQFLSLEKAKQQRNIQRKIQTKRYSCQEIFKEMFKQKNVNIRANYLIVCNIAAKKYSSKITKQNFSFFF